MRLIKGLILFVLLIGATNVRAQVKYYQHDSSIQVVANGVPQVMPWSGGFNNPQFTMGDLNRDGLIDLVVFEPWTTVKTFLNTGTAGNPRYVYSPVFALNFPPVLSFAILADYNCDQVPDLFQRGETGFAVYTGYYNSMRQLCFTFYRNLFYYNDSWAGGPANAFCNPGDIPAIADVDNDGDLDFVSYDISGGTINMYKNMRVEMGLPCDSIHIALKDRCWGKVYQGFYRTHQLGYSCNNSGLGKQPRAQRVTHSGNTPCLFDWDMDGDYDYLDGSVSWNEMTFLKNGKAEYGGIDSMVAQDTLWQTGGKQISIPVWPAAFNVDIDQDGKKDLLISPNGGAGSENYNCIWYYRNLSTPGAPNWQFQSDSFLTDQTIDLGTGATPMFYDYNRDGKPDLFIGSDGYRQSNGLLQSKIVYYEHTGTPGNPVLTLRTKDFLGIGSYAFKGNAPAFGDIDNDGKADMVLGHLDGTMSYFKNMAADNLVQPDWQLAQLYLTDDNGDTIYTDGHAAPFIYDIDKDGKPDLITGDVYGRIRYYQNTNTVAGNASLKLITKTLGKVKADPKRNVSNYSMPFIGRIDSTGTDYLLVGSNSGNIYRYTGFQGGDTSAVYTLLDSQYAHIDSTYNAYYNSGTAYGIYDGHRTAVTVADAGLEGGFEMIVGNVLGGVELYKWKIRNTVETTTVNEEALIQVFPNPASNWLTVNWSGLQASELQISIINMAGQVLYTASMNTLLNHASVPLSGMANGVYICVVQSGVNRYYSKFTVLR